MIHASRKNRFQVEAKIRNHDLILDLEKNLGGDDTGPNPHELVEVALATCTIQTCLLYANRKEWPLNNVDVEVEITSETRELTTFARKIRFGGPLSPEQITRLSEIADKCPIHRMLRGQVSIETSVTTDPVA